MIKEFKKFIFRGNVVDLAVGVVVGSAFTAIVNSLVNNIIMPFVGVLTAGVNFKDITIDLSGLSRALGNTKIPETGLTISIGLFINAIVEFLIIAVAVFLFVKAINVSRDKMEEIIKKDEKKKAAAPVVKSEEVKLLEEIRDLLKKKEIKKK
jgi:large conductance mechanosensitive channel